MKVCLDSRLIKNGEYFVPVKGENFDGHQYIQSSLAKGAAGVFEEADLYKEVSKKLKGINPRIIGITGSSGKTTTARLLFEILSSNYRVCLGTLNTRLGLSVNVINDMSEDCEFFVAEMGMDRAGELAETTNLFPLDVAVITTINHVHVEKLGSMEKLFNAKGEILRGLKNGGIALLNAENSFTRRLGRKFGGDVIWFDSKPLLYYPSNLEGSFNIRNANVCTILGRRFSLSDKQILNIIKSFQFPKGRLNFLFGTNGSTLIDDSYNANPESVRYALEILVNHAGGRKIAILGDMLELGRYKIKDHAELGKYINTLGLNVFIGVGKLAKIISSNIKNKNTAVLWIENSDKFPDLLVNRNFEPLKDDLILVKGSQGIRMEKIVKMLMRHPDKAASLLVRQDPRWV